MGDEAPDDVDEAFDGLDEAPDDVDEAFDGLDAIAPASAPIAVDKPALWEEMAEASAPAPLFEDPEEFAPTADEEISPVVWAPTADEFSPVSAPVAYPAPTGLVEAPISAFEQDLEEAEAYLLNPFHIFVIASIAFAVLALVFWKCCKSWKMRREKQMLRHQSTRVDAMLGDMQM